MAEDFQRQPPTALRDDDGRRITAAVPSHGKVANRVVPREGRGAVVQRRREGFLLAMRNLTSMARISQLDEKLQDRLRSTERVEDIVEHDASAFTARIAELEHDASMARMQLTAAQRERVATEDELENIESTLREERQKQEEFREILDRLDRLRVFFVTITPKPNKISPSNSHSSELSTAVVAASAATAGGHAVASASRGRRPANARGGGSGSGSSMSSPKAKNKDFRAYLKCRSRAAVATPELQRHGSRRRSAKAAASSRSSNRPAPVVTSARGAAAARSETAKARRVQQSLASSLGGSRSEDASERESENCESAQMELVGAEGYWKTPAQLEHVMSMFQDKNLFILQNIQADGVVAEREARNFKVQRTRSDGIVASLQLQRAILRLQGIRGIRALSRANSAALLSVCEQRTYAEGDLIMEEGSNEGFIFFLVDGNVRVETRKDGRVGEISAPCLLGETGLSLNAQRTASMFAVGDVEGTVLTSDGAQQLLATQGGAFETLVRNWLTLPPNRTASQIVQYAGADDVSSMKGEASKQTLELLQQPLRNAYAHTMREADAREPSDAHKPMSPPYLDSTQHSSRTSPRASSPRGGASSSPRASSSSPRASSPRTRATRSRIEMLRRIETHIEQLISEIDAIRVRNPSELERARRTVAARRRREAHRERLTMDEEARKQTLIRIRDEAAAFDRKKQGGSQSRVQRAANLAKARKVSLIEAKAAKKSSAVSAARQKSIVDDTERYFM